MPKKRHLMTADEVAGAWAIVPAPAIQGADDWRGENTVDLDETSRAIDQLIKAGIDGVLSLGTLGECATLTRDEKKAFVGALVEAAAGRVPVFVGTTTLNTRDTIRDTRMAADIGADGTLLGVPMWCRPSVATAVRFYADVAEACSNMAIAVYANPEAFRFEFPTAFWAQVAAVPQVITAKRIGLDGLLRDIEASRRRIRFLPMDAEYYAAARVEPDFCVAFWSSGAACGPAVVTHLRDAVAAAKKTGDWTTARMISAEIGKTIEALFSGGSFKDFAMYNIGLEKARIDAGGWMKAGPARPPYHLVPGDLLQGARKSGKLWAELETRLRLK